MSLAPGKPGLGTSLFPSNEDEDPTYFAENEAFGSIKIPFTQGSTQNPGLNVLSKPGLYPETVS